MQYEESLLNFNQSILFQNHSKGSIFRPRSLAELAEEIKSFAMLKSSKQKRIHVLGECCSFKFPQTFPLKAPTLNNEEDQEQWISTVTCDLLIDMTLMNKVLEINHSSMEVTVEAGITYSELVTHLAQHGLALSDISAYTDVTVGGASATGSHGSGERILSDQFVCMEIVTAAGEIYKLDDVRMFTHLGVLGVVATVTIKCTKMFYLKQSVYFFDQWPRLKPFLSKIVKSDELVSAMLRVDIKNEQNPVRLYIRRIATGVADNSHEANYMGGVLLSEDAINFYGGIKTEEKISFTSTYWDVIADHTTLSKRGLLGNGKYFQAEYFLPIDYAGDAIDNLLLLANQSSLFCEALPSGIKFRFVKGDNQLMSPCYDPDGKIEYFLAIQFSLYASEKDVNSILSSIEKVLLNFKPTTHWGKLWLNLVDLHFPHKDRYKKMNELRQMLDPQDFFIDHGSCLHDIFKSCN